MTDSVLLWENVPNEERQQERLDPIWGTRVQHRGCAGAVPWPDGQGYHRCATQALKAYGLCRRHAERAGVISPTPKSEFPRGLDNRIGNLIVRHVIWQGAEQRVPAMTVDAFRQLSTSDLECWRNAGRLALAKIREIQTTWTDDELILAFRLRSSPFDTSGDFAVCNWVGEGVPA